MRGCLSGAILVLVVAVVIGGGLGYLGLAPGLAGLFGSDQPRDLGVRYTPADLRSYYGKSPTRVTLRAAAGTPAESYAFAGSAPVRAAFTGEELTAVAAERAEQWAYFPVSDLQIRIHDDGLVEASGILLAGRLGACLQALGLPASAIDATMSTLKVTGRPPIYVCGTGSVRDGRVTLDVQRLEIGRLPVPAGLIRRNEGLAAATIEQVIRASGVSARSVTFGGGELRFEGTMPQTRTLSPAR